MTGDAVSGGARLDTLGATDDAVAAFQIEDAPVRGRIVRLADALDEILSAHPYPEAVARLLGEAVIAVALVGDSLKFDGRLILQASGDGPVGFLVADWRTDGGVRAYARIDPARADEIGADSDAAALLGAGSFAMTIDPGEGGERYQGLTALEGARLADSIEAYFRQSEQTPTRIRIAVARFQAAGLPRWRGGGMILQQIAGDDARGQSDEDWANARALFDTVTDAELADPDLSSGRVLFRLFHETGARLFPPTHIKRYCQCSAERVRTVLSSFPAMEREAMQEPGGTISAACEYCGSVYRFTLDDFPA